MPGYDRTGPAGRGAMTGWAAGRCGGDRTQPARFGGWGGGMGRGFGGGRGRWCAGGPGRGGRGRFAGPDYGYGNVAPYPATSPALQADPDSEKRILQSQANLMSEQLEEIRRRLNELEGNDAE
jgi:hypothetical protein